MNKILLLICLWIFLEIFFIGITKKELFEENAFGVHILIFLSSTFITCLVGGFWL